MNVPFRMRRYRAALLWHWLTPFCVGGVVSFVAISIQMAELAGQFDLILNSAISACSAN